MDVTQLVEKVRDSASAGRVYGEPYEKNGLTVIPAAAVAGGGGGGGDVEGSGGGGVGLAARPVGAWIIESSGVRWMPAVDVTRIVLGSQLVAFAALLVARSVLRSRSKRSVDPNALVRVAAKLARRLPRR